MDASTLERFNRGRAIRLVMEQRQFQTVKVTDQIAIFLATINGLLDGLDEENNKKAQKVISQVMKTTFAHQEEAILSGKKLDDKTKENMIAEFKKALQRERILP